VRKREEIEREEGIIADLLQVISLQFAG